MNFFAPRWLPGEQAKPDTHAAFRLRFTLSNAGEIHARVLGASWFGVWLDGDFQFDGPTRFHFAHPEWQSARWNLSAGRHVLAAQVHYSALDTRLMLDLPPFFGCELEQNGALIEGDWKCCELQGFERETRRVNPQLGWIEWCDTAQLPQDENERDWREPDFDDASWQTPVEVTPPIEAATPPSIALVSTVNHAISPIAQGTFADTFGYARDDPPTRFLLRELAPQETQLPAQGVWQRYDLGRVRLGRARLRLEAPRGTQVQIAYAESLTSSRGKDRVAPFIALSAGLSCNLDSFTARGGVQEFCALEPRGGRFIEAHISPPHAVRFDAARVLEAAFLERTYYAAPPVGDFECDDELLNAIWRTGVETVRACVEDAPTDSPTRERGAWTGDLCTVLESAACAFSDLRPFRRGLKLAAQCAREDGLIAGLCPGGGTHMPTYAGLWLEACWRYFALTGDHALLHELRDAGARCVALFAAHLTAGGITDASLGWSFVDWGHERDESGHAACDLAANLLILRGLRAWQNWTRALNDAEQERATTLATQLDAIMQARISQAWDKNGAAGLGYHATALALSLGLLNDCDASANFVRAHWENCFPMRADAPRQSGPEIVESQIVTPYFAHFAFAPLMSEHSAWVQQTMSGAWGWMLKHGATTWWEVFDARWSHCHAWSGAPTWLLSRYALGLQPRFDEGANCFTLDIRPGALRWARGRVPLPSGESLHIEWQREGNALHVQLQTPEPVRLRVGEERFDVPNQWSATLPASRLNAN